ncbi:MAG: site-specific DNA-methyltransferase [Betaproteobacteria bacterium]|jgi:adenine-specific DNA-methyltransferase|uniref:site-specific DNA-methyltransferase n=1 Tax=Silanimonas sp. TaxID=1929290 RepID=UPI0022BA8CB8|nr:site-specific DNA-methyltransferase [Silanimonas sp.]MCZ8167276.1 site-specific DNA-methyltransferase [Silanimonas sp.]
MATKKSGTTFVGVDALKHADDKRKNIPTAEYQSLMADEARKPVQVTYSRTTSNADHLKTEKETRNHDLDPQLVWRGKDAQDWTDLVVNAPPLYIQEKVHPKVLIDDLLRQSRERREAAEAAAGGTVDMFGDFNGIPAGADKTDFYAHDQNWTNRMILGDSLQVMASLAEREGLRGKVQCVYIDPPYGIKFNSNFQWSTTSRDVKDGNRDHISREPEQVKAFRDTWRDGINSYLTYLRDRLTVARDLLTESGSVFVQIGDENVHRVRVLMDEVFGDENCVAQIATKTSGGSTGVYLAGVQDHVLWYCKSHEHLKYRPLFSTKAVGEEGAEKYTRVRQSDLTRRSMSVDERTGTSELQAGARAYRQDNLTSQSVGRDKGEGAASWFPVQIAGQEVRPSIKVRWKTNETGMQRLLYADRVELTGNSLAYVRYLDDFGAATLNNSWSDIGGIQSRLDPKVYVVQTPTTAIQRCMLMATDPGDLVLDPTCGSGTTAYVAEQWGRRWITIDTSRVALALARARIMGARYPYYLLADSPEGQLKEAEVTRGVPSSLPTRGNIRQGFVYERVPHVTLKSIANNAEIDVIWDTWQKKLEPLREALNAALEKDWQDWQIPREPDTKWNDKAKKLHADWWAARIERQREIDASIAAKAESEYLYDKPYEDKKRVRVAGPFTVDSLSPHRTLAMDIDDGLIDGVRQPKAEYEAKADFASVMLENLKAAGVQQAHKADRISFTSIVGWPGEYVCAEGRYMEGEKERRAAIFIGPEFGTVSRPDLVGAAREAADAGFDVLIACAFNYEAHAAEFEKLGRVPVLKARMNPDLHMAGELKNTGAGNLFVVFGEPDIRIEPQAEGKVRVRVKGVDVFRPQTGEIESGGTDSIALWMIDTEYNEESFFVRQAYFLGASDPYKALKTTLKAEIDAEAWATLNSDVSRAFEKPKTGRIAVKVINHLGDEVMKVFGV